MSHPRLKYSDVRYLKMGGFCHLTYQYAMYTRKWLKGRVIIVLDYIRKNRVLMGKRWELQEGAEKDC